ncbi:MAG: HAMP domain-containing protein [Nitrospiraceae bacterium]|nr:HAMP domain-containing protein [Nitrospiraceae bacterium]
MSLTPATYPRVRWHESIVFRVVVLCGILLLCLLGSVYQITRHYFRDLSQEMESRTADIADMLVLQLEENSVADLDQLEQNAMAEYDGIEVDLSGDPDAAEVTSFVLEKGEDGALTKVARMVIGLGDRKLLLTARVALVPQTEVIRAFKNKYIAALIFVFLVTLGLMLYVIVRMLRPLTELSESCAQISSGTLRNVGARRNSGEILALEQTFNKMVASLREKERIEANLRQAQRLSAIGNLAAGVAHDVRNPLNAIKLLSSHAMDTLCSVPEAEGSVKQLQTIRTEVDRLEEIVSGFLSLAKERELQPEPTRIDLILDECARLVRKDAEERGVQLVVELRAGDTSLMVDPKQMTRAVLNVLLNALEVCPPEGRVRLFSRITDRTCEIEVRDDGPGITPEVAERAFEPYFTTKETGTGLGLSLTRGIVEEHGGAITLTSMAGQGSQVLIILPLKMEES